MSEPQQQWTPAELKQAADALRTTGTFPEELLRREPELPFAFFRALTDNLVADLSEAELYQLLLDTL